MNKNTVQGRARRGLVVGAIAVVAGIGLAACEPSDINVPDGESGDRGTSEIDRYREGGDRSKTHGGQRIEISPDGIDVSEGTGIDRYRKGGSDRGGVRIDVPEFQAPDIEAGIEDFLGQGGDQTGDFAGPFPVTRMVDGDTLIVNVNGSDERVRIIGLDTPETVHPSKPTERCGPEASDFAKQKLTGQRVWLEYDPSQQRTDRYDRTLAHIHYDSGSGPGGLYAQDVIAAGLGEEYTFGGVAHKYQGQYRQAQSAASGCLAG